jgi:DNA topoisomerase-2
MIYVQSVNMNVEDFKALDYITHVRTRPDIYVGGCTTQRVDEWVYDMDAQEMVYTQGLVYNEALLKIIFEVIDNAVDSSVRSKQACTIRVHVHGNEVRVENDGPGIPIACVDIGTGTEAYIPTTIFSVPMSGSNFKEDREGIGMNGIGVKATNIFSRKFDVECITGGQKFTQSWTDGMRVCTPPRVRTCARADRVRVAFEPDLAYFTREDNECNVSNVERDLGPLIRTRLLGISCTQVAQARIFYNGTLIKARDFKAFIKLFTSRPFFYDTQECADGVHMEYGVACARRGVFEHESFVNTQRTPSEKSTHTRLVTSKVVGALVGALRAHAREGGALLGPAHITPHLHVFVNVRMRAPAFTSQTKVQLSSNIKGFELPARACTQAMKRSGLLEELARALQERARVHTARALNGTKSSHVHVPKLDDAHIAGTRKSADATLFLVEGDSAKTFVSAGMSVIGRAKYGVFPLKGKVLNVLGTSRAKLTKNEEIANIMKIVGLQIGRTYESEEDMRTLRYGRVCFCGDADYDSYHIMGLLVTFFHTYWPALLQRGYLTRFISPLIRVRVGTHIHNFFTCGEYDAFARANEDLMRKARVKYYKGLGGHTREEVLGYFKQMEKVYLKDLTIQEDTPALIKHIFDPQEAAWRKNWLCGPAPARTLDYGARAMRLTDFLQSEVYEFSMYNIQRAIPSAIDGLKISQRKILYTCLQLAPGSYKVAQLASLVAARTNYAHGEASLQKTITGMAQSFAGSNNEPLLQEEGAFGSRMRAGADAASPRYIFTSLRARARALFKDTEVLTYRMEENMRVQPEYYVPVLPMVLINGASGIATGFRSQVPCFNPVDIVHNIRALLQKQELRPMVPWYGGTYTTNEKTRDEGTHWVFCGACTYEGDARTIVHELPIGVCIEDYKEKVLIPLVAQKKIKKFDVDHASENEPRFILHGHVPESELKLECTMTKKCMNLLDREGRVRTFESPEEILVAWFHARLECIRDTRAHTLRTLRAQHAHVCTRARFIELCVRGEIEIRGVRMEEVRARARAHGICEEDTTEFMGAPISSFTREKIDALHAQAKDLDSRVRALEAKTEKCIMLEEIGANLKKRARS